MKDIIFIDTAWFFFAQTQHTQTSHTHKKKPKNHCTPMHSSAKWKLTIFISNIYLSTHTYVTVGDMYVA